jgi:hypothetical protein
MARAGDRPGGAGALLTWRPYRPSEVRAARGEEQRSRAERASLAQETPAARVNRRTLVDPQVKRVVLQQVDKPGDDPLGNPFEDAMPRSPFGAGAPQVAPETTPARDAAPVDSTPPGPVTSTAAQQPPPPNPFEDDRTQPPAAGEADRFRDLAPPPAGDNDNGPRSSILPPSTDPDAAPDPKQDCETALRVLKANRLTRANSLNILDLAPREAGEFPFECRFGDERQALNAGRSWSQTCYTWKASGLCHKPLYFEQVHMERYGHSWGPVLDPVISGAHFFASVPLLPYHMGLEPPCECIYPLGHYRPGSCAPHYIEPWPWSIRGGALQAAAVTGLIFAVP